MSAHSDIKLQLTGVRCANSTDLTFCPCTWAEFVTDIQHGVGEKDGLAFVPGSFTTYDAG